MLFAGGAVASFTTHGFTQFGGFYKVKRLGAFKANLTYLIAYLISWHVGHDVIEYSADLARVALIYRTLRVGKHHARLPYRRTCSEINATDVGAIAVVDRLEGEAETVLPYVWGYFFFSYGYAVIAEIALIIMRLDWQMSILM